MMQATYRRDTAKNAVKTQTNLQNPTPYIRIFGIIN